MDNRIKQTVEMTPEEVRAFKAWRAEQELEERKVRRSQELEAYRTLVDEQLEHWVERFKSLTDDMRATKVAALDSFLTVIQMKRDLFGLPEEGQRSHMFTNRESTKRIVVGANAIDGYLDTVNEGIDLVRAYITSLATDDSTKVLVDMVLRLLAKDSRGNLKASRVVQLRKIAEELGAEQFLEGVQLIEDSYQPSMSSTFIRVEEKDRYNNWIAVPLNITELSTHHDAHKLMRGEIGEAEELEQSDVSDISDLSDEFDTSDESDVQSEEAI